RDRDAGTGVEFIIGQGLLREQVDQWRGERGDGPQVARQGAPLGRGHGSSSAGSEFVEVRLGSSDEDASRLGAVREGRPRTAPSDSLAELVAGGDVDGLVHAGLTSRTSR